MSSRKGAAEPSFLWLKEVYMYRYLCDHFLQILHPNSNVAVDITDFAHVRTPQPPVCSLTI